MLLQAAQVRALWVGGAPRQRWRCFDADLALCFHKCASLFI